MAFSLDHTLSDRLRRMVDTIVDEVDPVRIVLFPKPEGTSTIHLTWISSSSLTSRFGMVGNGST